MAMQLTDILIHVNETTDDNEKNDLVSVLREMDGVIAPRFSKEHLLLVAYNAEIMTTSSLLNAVQKKGYQAQLIGL